MPIDVKPTHPLAGLRGRSLFALAAVLLFASTVIALRAGEADAATCSRPTLAASTRALVNGESIVVGGTACGSAQIFAATKSHWRRLGTAPADRSGHFTKRLRLDVPTGVGIVELKAVSARHASPRLKIRVKHRRPVRTKKPAPIGGVGTGSPVATEETKPTPVKETHPTPAPEPIPTPAPEPPPVVTPEPPVSPEPPVASEPPATPEPPTIPEPPVTTPPETKPCAMAAATTSGNLQMTVPACQAVATDTAQASSPLGFWGSIQCANQSRYETVPTGGDTHLSATGAAQGNSSYRRLTVDDGDNFSGARCELGLNSHGGPTAFYREGEHRVTYYSERLPSNFPLSVGKWQTVMQMKQAEPQHDGNTGVALEMEARQNAWVVSAHWTEEWRFPAQVGVWTRFAWDVYYSKDPSKGWLQVSADLNGDGDFDDPGERSPVIHTATLATEIPGYPTDGITPGTGITSHLRMGIYHDPAISCPAPTGCSVEVDNVQVVAP